MPYTQTTWTDNVTAANQSHMSNLEKQYTEATLSFGPDLFAAGWVVSGLTGVKDVNTANQLNLQAGTAYLLQADGTTRQRAITAQSFTTSTPSTTYYLDINPDGTLSWSTSHSGTTNHLTLLSLTTDGAHNILAITDARLLASSLLSGMAGVSTLNLPGPLGIIRTQNNSFAGTVIGGVTFGQVGALTGGGDPNGAALFNGTTGWIQCPPGGLPTSGSMSIECLVKIASNPAGTAVPLEMGAFGSTTCVDLVMNTTGQVFASNQLVNTGVSAALSTNVWHHVVLTYDGANLRCYVDGSLTGGPTAAAVAPTYSTVGVAIGNSGIGSLWFPGQIDEVACYNTALSAARVTAHFNAVANGGYLAAVQADSPLRLYRLGDAVGSTTAADTIPATVTALLDAGGGVDSVGGVPTAGALGVPAIVAQAIAVPVTVTTLQTILTYTPTATGLYRASLWAYANSSSTPTALSALANYFSPASNSATAQNFAGMLGNNAAPLNGVNTWINPQNIPTMPLIIYHAGGQAITVSYRNPTGTINDSVSAVIERLA